jgi:hypothetical protein
MLAGTNDSAIHRRRLAIGIDVSRTAVLAMVRADGWLLFPAPLHLIAIAQPHVNTAKAL